MWHDIGTVVFAFTFPIAVAAIYSVLPLHIGFIEGWQYSAGGGTVVSLVFLRDWPWLTGSAASLLVALAIRWWRSSKRRRAAALLGAKSRALRDTIVRRAREAAQPRPVLRPLPGGAR